MTRSSRAALPGVVLGLALAAAGEEPAQSPPPNEEPQTGEAASSDATDWARRPDWTALRRAWGERDDFSARCELRPIREAFGLANEEKWDALAALTAPWVARCPIDPEAHALRSVALDHLGSPQAAHDHGAWAHGLFESILASGDGRTSATAYLVVAVYEEYAVLRYLGLAPRRQALTAGGRDAMSVVADGEERTVYFDPAPSFERLRKALERMPRGDD